MIEGSIPFDAFTVNTMLLELRDTLFTDSTSHYMHLKSQQMYWELQYLAQGKRYPRTKKRKNQARMSRKWRGIA